MASKRKLRRRSCEGKIRYKSYEEAVAVATRLTKQLGEYYRVYRCQFCKGTGKRVYHVGRASLHDLKIKEDSSRYS